MPKNNFIRSISATLIIGLCVIISHGMLNFYLNKKITGYLTSRVANFTGGDYVLSLGDMRLNILTMSIAYNNVKLLPVKLFSRAKETKYSLSANEVQLNAINLLSYFKDKAFIAKALRFERLTISIFKHAPDTVKPAYYSTIDDIAIYPLIASKFKDVKIDSVIIGDTRIKIYNPYSNYSEVFAFEEQDVRFYNVIMNKDAIQENRLIVEGIFNIRLPNSVYKLEQKKYKSHDHTAGKKASYSILSTTDQLRTSRNYKKTI